MACLILNDPHTGVRGIPRSSCQQKDLETRLVDYRFNDCGFRTNQPCRPGPAGLFRIVLIGSSMGYGMHVDQSQSFAARLGPVLSARLQRPVDVFNESMQWAFPASWPLRTDAMLQPHPGMILWALTPFDIENARLILPYVPNVQAELLAPLHGSSGGAGQDATVAPAPPAPHGLGSIPERAWNRLITTLSRDQATFVLQHYLYRSQSQYLAHTLSQVGASDYLQVPAPAALQDNLVVFARALRQVAARARAANVPLVVTLLPSRPQAIMLSNHTWSQGYDPNQLGRLLRRIVEADGARYVDMTPGLETMPDAGQNYLSVDEHPTPQGHRMLTTLLANALLRSGALPAAGSNNP